MSGSGSGSSSSMEHISEVHKGYEKSTLQRLRADQPVLVRLDGHRFSSFTKGFHKPYDMRIFRAMLNASSDLLGQLNPISVFTQSDEITMVFGKQDEHAGQTLPFMGKTQKFASLASAYCSVRFGYHLEKELEASDPALLQIKKGIAHFDARVFNVPDAVAVAENLMWRQNDAKV